MTLFAPRHDQMLRSLCQAENRPGLYLRFRFPESSEDPAQEVCQAAPLLFQLSESARAQFLSDGLGFVFFESVEEMRRAFDQIVSPDGPEEHQEYRGPARVFAVACDASGQILGDNTASRGEAE